MRKLRDLKGVSTNLTRLGVLAILMVITPNLMFSCKSKNADSSVTISEDISNVIEVEEVDEFLGHIEEHPYRYQSEYNPVYGEVYDLAEQVPEYPGGEAELKKYIAQKIQYPENAVKNKVQGRAIVKFIVTKSGSIEEVEIVRSVDAELDVEAIRVVKTLPNFIPGKVNGEVVNVWYVLPVSFKLKDNTM